MRAVTIDGFGGPEVVALRDMPRPTPAGGQVLIRVAAAGVNPVDWKIREGYMKDHVPFTFPTILGNEVAGTVEAVGGGVSGLSVGDAVFAAVGIVGGFADYVAVDAKLVAKSPASLSPVEAAAVPIAAVTAIAALDAGEIGPGSRLLIHAAAGGVGSMALQLARARGAEVTALTSPGSMEFVRGLGATEVVDRTSDYGSQIGQFDMVLDAFGPAAQERSWSLIRPGGILVSLVAPPPPDVAAAHGVRGTMVFGAPSAATLEMVGGLIDSGQVKVTIARTYPVEEAVAALAEVQGGQVRGKVVLTF